MHLRSPAPLVGSPAAKVPALLTPAWRAALWALVLSVLAVGLFLPDLMYGDAAQDAVMAMRMFREGDLVHLLRDGKPYLDKPHLLFWSAMAAYRVFGVHDFSYRLPSVLVSLLGAFSTGRLARRLYGARAGEMAALLFITAQAILLGDHDVRMDALLTGFTAFGLWQLVRWADTGDLYSLAAGAAGVGLAVDSKGMVAAALCGLCLVLYLWGRRRLGLLASPRIAVGLLSFLVFLAPVLFAYQAQFGAAGVRFILLGQSADRFMGGHGEAAAHDYLFFFHSLLWAFLPWTAPLLCALGSRFRELWRGRWAAFHGAEELSFLGPIVYITGLNFSRFKLPHYLNVSFPLLAVLTAGWLCRTEGTTRAARVVTRIQDVLIAVLLLGTALLNGWAFPVRSGWVLAGGAVFAVVLVAGLQLKDPLLRLFVPSAVAILLANLVLEANFYPQLALLQPGPELVRRARSLEVDFDRLYFVGDNTYQPFQFYAGRVIPAVPAGRLAREVAEGGRAFALVDDHGLRALAEAGLDVRGRADWPACRITRITWTMVDPRTRPGACPAAHLVELDR